MHPRTIIFASIWAAFYGAPLCSMEAGRRRGRAPGTPDTSINRARRLDTSYRHRGAGVENPRLPQRCTRSRRRPGSPGGRQRSGAASGSRARPATPLGANFGRPKNCNQAWPAIAHSATPGGFQHKVSCPKDEPPPDLAASAKERARGSLAAAPARQPLRPRSTPPAGFAESRRKPPRPGAAGGQSSAAAGARTARGARSIRWRRRAAPLRFAAGRLKP